jgi:hypothetical protein
MSQNITRNPFARMKELENRLLIVEELITGRIRLFQDIDQRFTSIEAQVKHLKQLIDERMRPT